VLEWILGAALVLSLLVAASLWVALRRIRNRVAANESIVEASRVELQTTVERETAILLEEIRRTVARARADPASLLAEEDRRRAEEQRAVLARREQELGDAIAATLAEIERRVEDRLRGFSDDVDRAQVHLQAQLARIDQRQRQAIADVEARVEAEAAELGSTADEQRKTVLRLREELERAAGAAVTEALDQLESQTVERRRAIEEITDRLRTREAAIADAIEKAETDARGRLEVAFVDFERRQIERLERSIGREIDRHVQTAVMAFDGRMREVREEAAERLGRELDRAVDLLGRQELARRLETESAARSRDG
jgi:uncharacterized protein YukE